MGPPDEHSLYLSQRTLVTCFLRNYHVFTDSWILQNLSLSGAYGWYSVSAQTVYRDIHRLSKPQFTLISHIFWNCHLSGLSHFIVLTCFSSRVSVWYSFNVRTDICVFVSFRGLTLVIGIFLQCAIFLLIFLLYDSAPSSLSCLV